MVRLTSRPCNANHSAYLAKRSTTPNLGRLGAVPKIMRVLGPQFFSIWRYLGLEEFLIEAVDLPNSFQSLQPAIQQRLFSYPNLSPLDHYHQDASEHQTTLDSFCARFRDICCTNWPVSSFTNPKISLKYNMARPSAYNGPLQTIATLQATGILCLQD